MTNKKRKICFVVTSFIHYSRSILILDELQKRSDVELHIVLGGIALSPKYLSRFTNLSELLRKKGINNVHEVFFNLESDYHVAKAKTAGFGVIEFASVFNKISPDLVVVRGDRFEILSAALAAAYMNIPIAHIEGGDISGTIDESVRHAVTKLSHFHFATNQESYNRILKMGERPDCVFNFGSPEAEIAQKFSRNKKLSVDLEKTGSGASVDLKNKYLIVMFHPVTTEPEQEHAKTRTLLEAVCETGLPAFWFWPNFDAGAEVISQEIRSFKEHNQGLKIKFLRYLPPEDFFVLLNGAACLIGNSSAGIKECAFLGVPVVNLGSRQQGRLRDKNVLDTKHNKEEIKRAINKQVKIGRFPESAIYCGDRVAKRIAKTLATAKLYIQKSFIDNRI